MVLDSPRETLHNALLKPLPRLETVRVVLGSGTRICVGWDSLATHSHVISRRALAMS